MNLIIKLVIAFLILIIFKLIYRFLTKKGYTNKSPIMYVILFIAIFLLSLVKNYHDNTSASLFVLMSKILEDMILYTLVIVISLCLDKWKSRKS